MQNPIEANSNYEDSKWDEVAGTVCYPGLQAKFQQNPHAMDTLIRKTGNKKIVECVSDRLWATGIPLTDPNCLEDTKWISQGILGQMLESIRNDSLNCHRGSMSIQYHHPANPSHSSSQSLLPDSDMQEHQIGASSMDVSDEILSTISCANRLPGESLSGQDSASASASTSPTSDTTATATDTDPGECPTEEPLRVSDQIPGVI